MRITDSRHLYDEEPVCEFSLEPLAILADKEYVVQAVVGSRRASSSSRSVGSRVNSEELHRLRGHVGARGAPELRPGDPPLLLQLYS